MYENILSNMLGCQTYCISDSPSNRYCLIGPIECNEKLIEVFKKGMNVMRCLTLMDAAIRNAL